MDDTRVDRQFEQQVQQDAQQPSLKELAEVAEVEMERIEAEKIGRLIEGLGLTRAGQGFTYAQ